MPLHDWTRVPAGLFHHFHQSWTIRIADALNAGRLPSGAIALVEQRSGPLEPDVLAIETGPGQAWGSSPVRDENGGIAVMEKPRTHTVMHAQGESIAYARRADRIVVRHHLGEIIAVIEIVSPGNKISTRALERFVGKTADFISEGVHVLVVDVFPPTPRDPQGIHRAIWDQLSGEPFEFPPGKDRTLASYESAPDMDYVAYVEPIAVGDVLADMPLFLTRHLVENLHVAVPLEATYQATWQATPLEFRRVVETGELPGAGDS